MGVDAQHEEYKARLPDWRRIRDALDGERVVKARRQEYLPPPPGMQSELGNELIGATGKRTVSGPYDFYLSFAEFPEIVDPALTGFQGMIHSGTPVVELPDDLAYVQEDATPRGDNLFVLWQQVTREVLAGGRAGLLAEIGEDDEVSLCPYSAESVVNWTERTQRDGGGASLVVLRECRTVQAQDAKGNVDPFSTEERILWRELRIIGGVYQVRVWEDAGRPGPANVSTTDPASKLRIVKDWVTPQFFGKPLDYIPFTCINALDIGYSYGAIPILPLVRRAFSIYRLTADYRRALYLKGDPQPYIAGVVKGSKDVPKRFGGEELWTFSNANAKVGFLDIDGQGIPLMRQAIADEYERFDQEGGRLLSTTQRAESGDALARRMRAHQVTLRNVVINAAMGMEQALRVVAEVAQEDEESVSFKPSLNFSEPELTGSEALQWVQAKSGGFPISDRTLHDLAVRGGVTDKSFEDEVDEMDQEGAALSAIPRPQPGQPGQTEPGQPEPGQPPSPEQGQPSAPPPKKAAQPAAAGVAAY